MSAVLRGPAERARQAIADAPIRMLLIGIVGYVLFAAIAAWMYSLAFVERLLETDIVPGFLAAGVVFTIVPLLLSLLGAPGAFGYVGDRIAALHGGDVSGLKRTVLGTMLSLLAAFFPVVGWFVVLPALLGMSLAAGAVTIFRRGRPPG